MPLFQPSVLKRYLANQDESKMRSAYKGFETYFGNRDIQANLRKAKEEQFQEGFLRELFVNVLGYTINPNPSYNLTTEFKNQNGSGKADGAILDQGKAICVIELKSTKVRDLKDIQKQAFNYKANQRDCVYVVTSNFERLRFYIDHAIEYEEFDLFRLSYERFRLMYLCLHKDNQFQGLPKAVQSASRLEEQTITRTLYKDYSTFRKTLFTDIVTRNEQAAAENEDQPLSKSLLLKKTQKLLDRLIFIFFAEDKGLLPPNSIVREVDQWEQLKKLNAYSPLSERFTLLFGHIYNGFQSPDYTIPKYEGELFKPDSVLDALNVDDDLLKEQTLKLSAYDFATDVDVNILGHIFEQSLTDLEEMQLAWQDTSKISKKKNDGVYYTPAEITKYMVAHSLGTLCEEKKAELQLDEDAYMESQKRSKKIVQALAAKLDEYRKWLLGLKILDPACGSGAFLNQALDFLIEEHGRIDRLRQALYGEGLPLSDISTSVLESNLYGVDVNEESVDIAKLSLWLSTASKNRPLSTLSNNIQCGNSLLKLDDSELGQGFSWEERFPDIMTNGKFDVIIGNPPYTYRGSISKEHKKLFKSHYECTTGNFDLYKFFIEKTKDLIKEGGRISFIVPNTFLTSPTYGSLRALIRRNFEVRELCDLGLDIFENVVVENIIFNFVAAKNPAPHKTQVKIQRDRQRTLFDFEQEYEIEIESEPPEGSFSIYITDAIRALKNKMDSVENSVPLAEITYCTVGINTGYIKDELTANTQLDDRYHRCLSGKDIGRHTMEWPGEWILYDHEMVRSHGDRGRSLPPEHIFTDDKILVQRTRRGLARKLICYLDRDKHYNLNRLSNIVMLPDKGFELSYVYLILNSSLLDFYFNRVFNEYEVKPVHLKELPIRKTDAETQKVFSQMAETILRDHAEVQKKARTFLKLLAGNFEIVRFSKQMKSWYHLDWAGMVKELKKKKVKLSVKQQAEWMEHFETQQSEILTILKRITKMDSEIDERVFELYGLSEEEKEMVKNSS